VSAYRHRVVYLSHAFHVGGAEEMVLNLVRHLPQRFEPVIVCIHSAGPIGEEIRKTGVEFHVLDLNPGWRHPFHLIKLERALTDLRADIVHTFLLTASLYGRLAAMFARVPVIIGTEVNIYENKEPRHIKAERWLMAKTDSVVVSAGSVRDFYIDQVGADPSKVEVIYNAVDWSQLETTKTRDEMREELQLGQFAPVAGIVARLTEQKAHSVLFQAMASTPGLERLHLVVVGDGHLREQLERQATDLGIADRVRFLGARRDLGNLMSAMDMFVMPSLWEGLPLSMVLAMGAGLPVVATSVAGIPEVVHDGHSGLLVPPGDAPALGAALSQLVRSSDLRRALGTVAQASALPRYGVDGYVSSVTALYDRLLAAKHLVPHMSDVQGRQS
jgi:glycosyltransferase involved in cell wall biosynthesis